MEFTFKECFYILPCLGNKNFMFMWFNFRLPLISKKIAWFLPFFAIQYKSVVSLWLGWINIVVYLRKWKFGYKTYKFDPNV